MRPILLALVLLAGCHDDGADSLSAVKAFFTAAEGGDCAALGQVILPYKGTFDDAQCKGLLEDFREKQTHLVGLGEPKVDGRNHDARMIPANLSFKGGPHQWLMRAEKHDGKWKVRF